MDLRRSRILRWMWPSNLLEILDPLEIGHASPAVDGLLHDPRN